MHPKLRQMKIDIKLNQLQIDPVEPISSEQALQIAMEYEEKEQKLSALDPSKLHFTERRIWATELASLLEEEEKEDDLREKACV